MSLDTIKEKRASLVSEMRNILDASESGISADNEEKYDKIGLSKLGRSSL